jgi:phosphomannomutase / phosphoglucomutase
MTAASLDLTHPNTDCFCTYDIRAIVNDTTFNEATYTRLGRALALWLAGKWQGKIDSPWIALGYDVRVHSVALSDALIAALRAEGLNVLTVGMVPSPIVYFAEHFSWETDLIPPMDAAVVVTASHNPAPYNGAKFTFEGLSISSDDLLEIKAIFASSASDAGGKKAFPNGEGETQHWDPIPSYMDWAEKQFGQFASRPKVVVDCGNGTAGVVAPQLFERLGCDVVPLFAEPDGRFPNHHPDPCQHKNLQDLIATVKSTGAALGIAFDGDTDRLGVVDSEGRIITGDFLLLLYAIDMMRDTHDVPPIVVSEVKCSQHLFDTVNALGAQAIMSPTGHAYIKNKMKEVNALLGGELSGHMFFRDKHWGFDDAIYAGLRLIALLEHERGQNPSTKLADLTRRLPVSHLSEEKRVYMPGHIRDSVLANLLAEVKASATFADRAVQRIETMDGIRLSVEGGFWLVRLSNTEPCLTLRAEGDSAEFMATLEAGLVEALYRHIRAQSPQWSPENPGVLANH